MNQVETTSSNSSRPQINLSFDDFELNAESFKPVTKGLGFHQEQKKVNFKATTPVNYEKTNSQAPLNNLLKTNDLRIKNQAPSGLEAFYGTKPAPMEETSLLDNSATPVKQNTAFKDADQSIQLAAWLIDLVVILSSVVLTCALLVVASGIDFQTMVKLVSESDLILFGSSIFAIYYMLYFTILELSTTPGKTILGIRLINTDQSALSAKHTFLRTLVSLLSLFVFCLPMILDFQGRLSDTKIVK